MLSKKSIVLNGIDNKSKRGVLTLECDGEITSGRLRLYNFGIEPRGIISLGIYANGKVVKAGLTHSSGMLFTFSSQLNEIPNCFSCAVINFVNGEPSPILFGNSEGYMDKEQIYSQVMTSLKTTNSASEVESVLDTFGIDYDDEEKAEIDKTIEENMTEEDIALFQQNKKDLQEKENFENECCGNCKDCENCKYKKYYFSNVLSSEKNDEIEETPVLEKEPEDTLKFYHEMKEQIDKLLSTNPSEDYLQELLPNSKFVKVTIDGGDYYVLGIINEDEKIKYICYGVPGVFQKTPPRELSGYPIWFPLDQSKPEGFGYWLSYQDADSGESVKAVVV